MTLLRAVGKKYEYYYCGKYRAKSRNSECTSHIVRADVVETLLLENIRTVSAFVNEYEGEFLQLVSKSTDTERNKQIKGTQQKHSQSAETLDRP